MCDPISLAITAATMLGKSYFEKRAADDVSDSQKAAQAYFNQDIDKQRDKAHVQFQDSTQQAGKTVNDTKMQEAVASREAANQPSFDQGVLLPGQGNSNNAVRTAIVQAQNQGIASNADAATRRANLDAFGDVDLGRNIALLQNSNRIATAGNFAGGAYPVLQADLASAAHAGDKNSQIADLIGAVGNLGAAGYGAASSGDSPAGWDFGGKSASISPKGIPVPGVKPTYVSNPFAPGGF